VGPSSAAGLCSWRCLLEGANCSLISSSRCAIMSMMLRALRESLLYLALLLDHPLTTNSEDRHAAYELIINPSSLTPSISQHFFLHKTAMESNDLSFFESDTRRWGLVYRNMYHYSSQSSMTALLFRNFLLTYLLAFHQRPRSSSCHLYSDSRVEENQSGKK
jgi:hypothetical protein